MLGAPIVVVAPLFSLADRVFCNPLVLYGLYILISVCIVILRMTILYIILAYVIICF